MEAELLGAASTVLTTKPFVSQAKAIARMRGDANYGLAFALGYLTRCHPLPIPDC